MEVSERESGGLGTDLLVYVCLLAMAGLQIFLAYSGKEGTSLFVWMFLVALVQAGLAIMFFMHLRSERRNLGLSLAISTIFVLIMMNSIWSDSFRLLHFRLLK